MFEIFSDLDGVLADFDAGVLKLTGTPSDQQRYAVDAEYRSRMWAAVGKYQKEGGEFWYELDFLEGTKLWDFINRPTTQILSATGMPHFKAAGQKFRWCAEKLRSDIVVNLVTKAEEKAQYARPNRILIDDKPRAIDPWVAAGGVGILHTRADKTIAELKELL